MHYNLLINQITTISNLSGNWRVRCTKLHALKLVVCNSQQRRNVNTTRIETMTNQTEEYIYLINKFEPVRSTLYLHQD